MRQSFRRGSTLDEERLRVRLDRPRRQAVGNDEDDIVASPGVCGEQGRGIGREAAAEVRAA